MEGLTPLIDKPWRFRSRPTRRGERFIAWCARVSYAELGNGPMDVNPNEEVHFEFGKTHEDALARLKRLVLS